MPAWFIHMNVAKKTIHDLNYNPRVTSIFNRIGPPAKIITDIATGNPAYFALGSIGPDLFVFLPDFKPPLGPPVYNIMKFMQGFYDEIEPYIKAYEDSLGPVVDHGLDIASALSGGLLQTLTDTASLFIYKCVTSLEEFAVAQYDWFSILGSGVPSGYDEQTFFWSDMLHYRKTFEFGARLWQNANTDQERAYALGWMTHLGTDVVGHSFVNQKCGGPFRLHSLRHHLIENHMDAYVYDREFGSQPMYRSLCGAAQHLWIAFRDDGARLPGSHADFLKPHTRPIFDPKDKQAMKDAWDINSDLPEGIKDLLIKTLQDVYPDLPKPHQTKGSEEQCADHPAILSNGYPKQSDVDVTDFYVAEIPNHGDIETAYFYLYHYVKMITTDYYKMQPPSAPPVFPWPDFPSPPGSPFGDGSSDIGLTIWEVLLAIVSWLLFIAECLLWLLAALAAGILGPLTWPARELVYQYVQLPMYNAWLSMHWVLSFTGYATPLPQEISRSLHTLGVGFPDMWKQLLAELNDPTGGLLGDLPLQGTEPSGVDRDEVYPRDVVSDPQSSIPTIPSAIVTLFDNDEGCSEFTRPWLFPIFDNSGRRVPTEYPRIGAAASPYRSGQDAYDLMMFTPGDGQFMADLEDEIKSGSANQTVNIVTAGLKNNKHLGDPSEYSAYVIAKLTRDKPDKIVNFNLDADRGYGFQCWDWLRFEKYLAAPAAYQDGNKSMNSEHIYHVPCQAGSGWDDEDILANQPLPKTPFTKHNPYEQDNYMRPVKIRFIDREVKFLYEP